MAATANKGAFQPVSFILFNLNLKKQITPTRSCSHNVQMVKKIY